MIPSVSGWTRRALFSILILALFPAGCRKVIKTKIRVEKAPVQCRALHSTLPELVQLVNTSYAGLASLVAKMRLELQGDLPDANYYERYRQAPAQLISQRPDSIRINVLNPLTRTTVIAMASSRANFQIWAPTQNKFVTGSTDLERSHDNPVYNVRPEHVLPAFLIEPLPAAPSAQVFLVEETDAGSKHYVIYELDSGKMRPKRRLWIERCKLELVRQDYYDPDGGVAGSIRYTAPVALGEAVVNTGVVLERPRDRYTLRLQLESKSLKVGRQLEERHFDLPVPPGAELITLR